MSRRTTRPVAYLVTCVLASQFCFTQRTGLAQADSKADQNQGSCRKQYDISAKGSGALQKVIAVWNATGTEQEQRIIGGQPAKIEDNPWQVAILASHVPDNWAAQFCGGSIIAKRWVLTAAHCVDEGTKAADISVLEGTASLKGKKNRVPVDQVAVHCNWNPLNHDSDIALLHVKSDLAGTPIDAIGADETGIVGGVLLRVSGWGLLSITEDIRTDVLYQTEVPYVPKSSCTQNKSYPGEITDNMLCAGREGKDTCTGDSGGPASIVVNGQRKLVGIVSWGEGCGDVNKPGVYTRVSIFRPWVKSISANEVKW
ncbi:S1 family peptidase [Tunturiibacter gelidiferens]|uniref:S1 family peptidase n=1 Tax=Tunturiibacter gelidiferens TaxID=3069689 RepID=UPI003D9B4C78